MKRKNAKNVAKKIALSGMFLSLALIVSLVESLLPPIIPALPYAKIGLGNVILLASFLSVGICHGYVIVFLRCILSAVFSGNMSSLVWSLPSAFVAYTLMIVLYKTKLFSIIGVSTAGGMTHNFIQICVASAVVGQSVFAYLPYMLLAGGLAGIITGTICYLIARTMSHSQILNADLTVDAFTADVGDAREDCQRDGS